MTASLKFLEPRDQKGIWFACDNGMFWPPIPAQFPKDMILLFKATCGVDSIQMISFSDDIYGYCDGEGLFNTKYSKNTSFHQQLVGPLLFLRATDDSKKNDQQQEDDDGNDGGEFPVTWSELIQTFSHSHNACGWPLTTNEKQKKASMASRKCLPSVTATSFIPKNVWDALWPANDDDDDGEPSAKKPKVDNVVEKKPLRECKDWYLVPTVYRGHILPLTMVKLNLANAAKVDGDENRSTRGMFVRREKIVDPRKPYSKNGKLVDTVSLTFLTVQADCQRPESIAHFLQDGSLVRGQVNCFAFECEEADSGYFEDIIQDIKEDNFWQKI